MVRELPAVEAPPGARPASPFPARAEEGGTPEPGRAPRGLGPPATRPPAQLGRRRGVSAAPHAGLPSHAAGADREAAAGAGPAARGGTLPHHLACARPGLVAGRRGVDETCPPPTTPPSSAGSRLAL